MAEREDVPSDELGAGESDDWDADARRQDDWAPQDDWGPDDWAPDDWGPDDWGPQADWQWDEPLPAGIGWQSTAKAAAPRPWYRRPGLLIAAIIAALVALVVASVLLLTNARFGESDDVRLRPTIHTSSVTVPSRTGSPRTSPSATPTTPTSSEPSRSGEPEEPAAVGEPEPQAPAPPPSRGAIGAQTPPPAEPEGPRTNVTRSPMSFTPGGR